MSLFVLVRSPSGSASRSRSIETFRRLLAVLLRESASGSAVADVIAIDWDIKIDPNVIIYPSRTLDNSVLACRGSDSSTSSSR
jgi:hypothetical protein